MTEPELWYPAPSDALFVCPECRALISPQVADDWTDSDMGRHLDWHRRL